MKALAKKRAKKSRQAMSEYDVAPVPRRYPNGKRAYSMDERREARARQEAARTEQDADRVALEARCRQAGWEAPEGGWVAEQLNKAKAQSMEGQAGLAITIGAKDDKERERLWNVWRGLDGAEAVYFRRIHGRSRHAKTAKIEMMPPEAMETRPDDKPDLRDDDAKDRDAVNAWMRWRGYVGHLNAGERHYIHGALMDKLGLLKDGKLSTSGEGFIAAMRVLSDVVEGK